MSFQHQTEFWQRGACSQEQMLGRQQERVYKGSLKEQNLPNIIIHIFLLINWKLSHLHVKDKNCDHETLDNRNKKKLKYTSLKLLF